jgi:hypothetical protein
MTTQDDVNDDNGPDDAWAEFRNDDAESIGIEELKRRGVMADRFGYALGAWTHSANRPPPNSARLRRLNSSGAGIDMCDEARR